MWGIILAIVVLIVIIAFAIRKNKGSGTGKTAELENAILSNDLGSMKWAELARFMDSKGVTEAQYQSVRLDAHKKRADQGAADSQYFYAILIMDRNKTEAEAYLKRSAGQGFIPAITKLQYAYADGGEFGKKPNEELFWTRKGADLGDTDSMIKLAREYSLGEIVEQSEEEEERWLTKAAELGNAQAYLGLNRLLKYMGNKEKKQQFLRGAISLAEKNKDIKAFEEACFGLGWYYKPLENNPDSDARRSTYFFILSHVLGNNSAGGLARENGYSVPDEEFNSWAKDAENLKCRM